MLKTRHLFPPPFLFFSETLFYLKDALKKPKEYTKKTHPKTQRRIKYLFTRRKRIFKKYLSHTWQPFACPRVTGAVPSLAEAGASACQESSSSGCIFTPCDWLFIHLIFLLQLRWSHGVLEMIRALCLPKLYDSHDVNAWGVCSEPWRGARST